MALRRGAATDTGRMREHNEDCLFSRGPVAAVADGMGGHNAGEVASRTAVDALGPLSAAGPWQDDGTARAALRRAVREANSHILDLAADDARLDGMGTTLTVFLEQDDTVHLAHVGDSRAYLLRGGELSRLTEDHTLVQELINEGRLPPEDAEHHPQRNIITRALGVNAAIEPDIETYKVQPGDRLLLCTDGLTGVVTESGIRNVLLQVRDPQAAADRLIHLANEGGGPDNITVIVLDSADGRPEAAVEKTAEISSGSVIPGAAAVTAGTETRAGTRGRPESQKPRTRGRRRKLPVIMLAGVALVALALAGWAFVNSRYFVGFHDDRVSVFRGVPGTVAGVRFARVVEQTPITRGQVPDWYAERLNDGIPAKSLRGARQTAELAATVGELPGSASSSTSSTAPPATTIPPPTTVPATTATAAPSA